MAKKEKEKLTKLEKRFKTMRALEPFVFRPFLPYKKHGHTEPFTGRAYIFVGNHRSIFDVVFSAVATDRPVHYLAKKELWEKGIFKGFVRKCECVPVSRDGTDVKAVMLSMKHLKNGECISIFPEGKRNKSKDVFLPFKGGAAAISIKTQTPIIPFVHYKKLRIFRRTHVIYGEPLEFTDYYGKRLTEEDIKRCDEILLNRMYELYNELKDIVTNKKKKRGQI